jgi:hypothetical protein
MPPTNHQRTLYTRRAPTRFQTRTLYHLGPRSPDKRHHQWTQPKKNLATALSLLLWTPARPSITSTIEHSSTTLSIPPSYPVQSHAGLLAIYMGAQPTPNSATKHQNNESFTQGYHRDPCCPRRSSTTTFPMPHHLRRASKSSFRQTTSPSTQLDPTSYDFSNNSITNCQS